jgi:hypothetical protein
MDYNKEFYKSNPLSLETINKLFKKHINIIPIDIQSPLDIKAEYHKIYIVTLPDLNKYFLRISHDSHPKIKTINEVACIQWIKENNIEIPVPEILFWSDSKEEIGYEYTVMKQIDGTSLNKIWKKLDKSEINYLINSILKIYYELRKIKIDKIGSLCFNKNNEIIVGPIVEITTYDLNHIKKYWKEYPKETFNTLNIRGPFNTYTDYTISRIKRDIYIIKTHKNCYTLKNNILPKLEKFLLKLYKHVFSENIDSIPLYLAHKDLHFGNIMWNNSKIVGILDWEFSSIISEDQWDPGNTLWTCDDSDYSNTENIRKEFYNLMQKDNKEVFNKQLSKEIKLYINKILSFSHYIIYMTITDKCEDKRKIWIEEINNYFKKIEIF